MSPLNRTDVFRIADYVRRIQLNFRVIPEVVVKKMTALVLVCLPLFAFAQDQKAGQKPFTLRNLLLEQLEATHTNKDWFVPANIAVQGVTPEQASWTDGRGNHSVGQLAYHLAFWNAQVLAKLKGETPAKFRGKNDETFSDFDAKRWSDTVRQLDQAMVDFEKFLESADEKTLEKDASTIATIAMHHAYHLDKLSTFAACRVRGTPKWA